jgi:hypothetical protein
MSNGLSDEISVSKHMIGVFDLLHIDWLNARGFKPAISLLQKEEFRNLLTV